MAREVFRWALALLIGAAASATDGWTRLGHVATYRTEVNQLHDNDPRYYKFKQSPLDAADNVWRHSIDGDNDIIALHANFLQNNIGDLPRAGPANVGRPLARGVSGGHGLDFLGRTDSAVDRPLPPGGWTSIRERNYGSNSRQAPASGFHQTRVGAIVPMISSGPRFVERPQHHIAGVNRGQLSSVSTRGSGDGRFRNQDKGHNSIQLPIDSIHTAFKSRRGMRKENPSHFSNTPSSDGAGQFGSGEKHERSKSGQFGRTPSVFNRPVSFAGTFQQDESVPGDIQLESKPILVTWT